MYMWCSPQAAVKQVRTNWYACDECVHACRYEEKMALFAKSQLNAEGNIHHTPQGLMYMSEWGSLRYAAGGAGIMAMYARGLTGGSSSNGIAAEEIMAFAEHQVTTPTPPPRPLSLLIRAL